MIGLRIRYDYFCFFRDKEDTPRPPSLSYTGLEGSTHVFDASDNLNVSLHVEVNGQEDEESDSSGKVGEVVMSTPKSSKSTARRDKLNMLGHA